MQYKFHEMDKKFQEIQSIIDYRKIKEGHKVQLLLDSSTTREIIKEILQLKEVPTREESKIHIMLFCDNAKLFDLFIDKMVHATNGITVSKRLEFTERAIIENLDILDKSKELTILDIGVGATHSQKLKAITTIELAIALSKIIPNVNVFGGDVRINEFEQITNENVKVNLFPLDIFEPKVYMNEFNKKYGFEHFDIIRCSNLLGHFKEEKRQIIVKNFRNLAKNNSLILFNNEYELRYTLFVNYNGQTETKLIY